MPETKTDIYLAHAFAELSKAAARRKIYSHKAAKDGRPEVAHFLRAMAASDAVQARRLFNSLIGRVDKSDDYLTTVFEKEVQEILASYTELLKTGLSPCHCPAEGSGNQAAFLLLPEQQGCESR
jgi:rubrerythrin